MKKDDKIYDFDQILDRSRYDAIKDFPQNEEQVGAIPAWIADMDFVSADPIVNALIDRMKFPNYGYTFASDRYYDAYINWLHKRHDWDIKKEWIIPNIGILHQMKFIYEAFAKKDDKVVIMPPLYPPFRNQISAIGGGFLDNKLILTDVGYEIDYVDLEEKLKQDDVRFLYFCNPHNPTGRVWTKDELKRVGEMCVENDVLIFSDDVHMDLTFKSHPYTPIATISKEIADITITAVAPNKTFNIAGLGEAVNIISNPKLMEIYADFIKKRRYDGLTIPVITATIAAYEDGENWLDQALDYIEGNIDYVMDYFNKYIPRVKIHKPDGTYLMWLDFNDLGMDEEALDYFLLQKAKVWMNSGYTFGKGGSGFMRLNVATQRKTVEKIVKQIRDAIDDL